MISKTARSMAWVLALPVAAGFSTGCAVAQSGQPSFAPTPSAASTRTSTVTPAFTITSTFTPTRIPLIARDLSAIILQESELPEDFRELEGRTGPECMSEIYADYPKVHKNLIHGYNRSFTDEWGDNLYTSSLFLYSDAESAMGAFRTITSEYNGDELELPDLGSERFAVLTSGESAGISIIHIIWRDEEAVLDLMYLGLDEPGTDEVIHLAQNIQERLEIPKATRQTPVPAGGAGEGRIGFFTGEKVYLVNADGTGLTCIAKRPVGSISFSPDGKRMVISSGVEKGDQGMYIMGIDGSEVKKLGSVNGNRPLWSPMGDGIIFMNADENGSLYAMDPDGKNLRRLTDFPPGEFTWYQKGNKIGLTQDFSSSIWVMNMNSDGSGLALAVKLLPFPYEGCCEWSPDGSHILYSSDRDSEIYKYHLYIMGGDGKEQRRLTNLVDQEWAANWSPDGSRIAFVYSYQQRLTTISPDGSNHIFLTATTDYMSCPIWSPDGTRIAFMVYTAGGQSLYSITADGLGRTLIAFSESQNIFCPVWVPG